MPRLSRCLRWQRLADFRRIQTKEAEIEARELLDDLIWMRLKGFHGACWGYNFDWQSRSFFAPRGTPTIVPTAFAARALCEAARSYYRETSICRLRAPSAISFSTI